MLVKISSLLTLRRLGELELLNWHPSENFFETTVENGLSYLPLPLPLLVSTFCREERHKLFRLEVKDSSMDEED